MPKTAKKNRNNNANNKANKPKKPSAKNLFAASQKRKANAAAAAAAANAPAPNAPLGPFNRLAYENAMRRGKAAKKRANTGKLHKGMSTGNRALEGWAAQEEKALEAAFKGMKL